MPQLRTEEILKQFTESSKYAKGNLETDISSLLEEYLTEAGLRELNQDGQLQTLPNFPEVAIILQHSAIIYSRNVDYLWLMVQNAVSSSDDPIAGDNNETSEERIVRRSKKQVVFTNFKPIDLDEASNITMRENLESKSAPVLPRAFMQFEPRVISNNDVQLTDYLGEAIGLMNDFRVNWNTDENFTLCDDMDFSTTNKHTVPVVNNVLDSFLLSPPDSGHTSDCFVDFFDNPMCSPDFQSNCSRSNSAPIVPVETVVPAKPKKRKHPTDKPKPKPFSSKYDMTSPLTGTTKCLKLMPSEFSIPDYAKNILIHRKIERMKMKTFLKDIFSSGDVNKTYLINDLSLIFKKRPLTTWSRLETLKKLKISQLFSENQEEKGFSEREDLDDKIIQLEKACVRLADNNSNDDMDRLSLYSNRNCMDDDDVPDDCYIEPSNIFEPSIARRLAEADSIPSPCSFDDQSDISKRIEAWHASIQEKLKIAERRRAFDLKVYSKDVLDAFNGDSIKNFGSVLKDKPSTDVARYFLTTLMLANKCKIVIEQPEPLTCGDFQISLPQGVTYDESDDSVFTL